MRPSKTFSFVFFAEEVEMLAAPTTAGSSASRREKAGTFGAGGGGGGSSGGSSGGGKNELRRINHLFSKSMGDSGGTRILWFLVPNGYPEMQESWISGTAFCIKTPKWFQSFQMPLFERLFANFGFLKIEIASSSFIFHVYWIMYHTFQLFDNNLGSF